MMRLFLASALHEMLWSLIHKLWSLEGKKVAYITNPADYDLAELQAWETLWWIDNDAKMLRSIGVDLYPVDLRVTQGDELRKELENLDGIYVSWGSTYYFRQLARESGYDKIIDSLLREQNKFYISTSAGSCVMGNKLKFIESGWEEYKLYEWLWFIPSMILPHRWSQWFKEEYEQLIPLLYAHQQSFITLSDGQALRVTQQWIDIIPHI